MIWFNGFLCAALLVGGIAAIRRSNSSELSMGNAVLWFLGGMAALLVAFIVLVQAFGLS